MYKFVVFDFDGVFTDNKIIFKNDNIVKYYNIKDGKGLSLLKKNNIKTGLISNFSTNKKILYNNFENLTDHLKFDKVFIGKGEKLDIIKKWLVEMNLTFNEIAFIGDDLNDLSIIKKVKLSACPNDAVEIVKNNVDYICEKNGGSGCVREFIDLILNPKKDLINEIRKEINYQLNNYKNINFDELIKLIRETNKNIYFLGIGKSGNMAKHCCDLFKSISINSHYLDCINLLHGDIGVINKNIIILFSKSGNTSELVNIAPFLKKRECILIGVICDNNGKLEKYCDLIIKTPFHNEIYGVINKIPTNSIMSQLLFINIIVSKLKNNLQLDNYKSNHPSGNIGENLLKIKDKIIYNYPKIILKEKIKLHDIFLEMTKYKIGCCFFINQENKLLGILTDGDIRRLLIKNNNLKYINIQLINKNYFYEENINKYIYEFKKYNYLPILNDGKIIGIIINF